MSADVNISPDSATLIGQMQGILRQHLPQQAGELFSEILTTNDELQAKCVGYEEEIKSRIERQAAIDEQHGDEIEAHEKTIRDLNDELEKLIEKVEEYKHWEERSERVEQAEREVATAILKVKLEESEKRSKDIRELTEMFATGKKNS